MNLHRCLLACMSILLACASVRSQAQAPSATEAQEIAAEAYVYAYPMVIAELTRRVSLGVRGVPMNQFDHRRAFPDANFTAIVRPNADTLYSILWFDLSREPLIINVPDSAGRYYLLQMMDMWTDTFDVPGSRTTGNHAQTLVLATTDWKGEIPAGALLIRSPTSMGWIIGRAQTNSAADYANVHKFQNALTASPLSHAGKSYTPPKTPVPADWDVRTPPVVLIDRMNADTFFSLFAELMKVNAPHVNDNPILHRIARIGLAPGRSFSFASLPAEIQQAVQAAIGSAQGTIKRGLMSSGVRQNGWRTNLTGIGTYGTDYRARASIAFGGLGANPIEDAIYPTALMDADGQPFSSDRRYTIHFSKEQLPPVRAFWSLTLYDQRQLFTANPINRYAIGDRDPLRLNDDGSLDIHIQRTSPGADKEANWLPAPASGPFSMNLRLYWPEPAALNGGWSPPPVKKLQ
ncbi:hypothetical protein HNQ60_004818 [Povalibacter uvarum]|uniref:DUF1254 domain-containing protein n=1 Tax=Povalibacter uvarum TaxID=732238 RepID=A0A841HRP1_9GAMM|nr:DUF1254 domain-containing protein [Povalibacter uvarum]MBB6095927.1 hypothetical protein [Povalibacter uvarum]